MPLRSKRETCLGDRGGSIRFHPVNARFPLFLAFLCLAADLASAQVNLLPQRT